MTKIEINCFKKQKQTFVEFAAAKQLRTDHYFTLAFVQVALNTFIKNGNDLNFNNYHYKFLNYFFQNLSLVQWLKYSKKEYCELCKHKFSFAPSKY